VEFLQCSIHAHSGGILVKTQLGPDLFETAILKVSQNDGGSISVPEFVEGVVENRSDLLPSGIGRSGGMQV
jgi:hypothetical protein